MSPRPTEIGPLELEVLGLLSESEPLGVADVQAGLKTRGSVLAYTTVLTVLTRLFQKGHLKRVKEGRQFRYVITTKKEQMRRSIFDRVKNSLFHSDRLNPILALLDSKEEALSADELRALQKVVEAKLRSAKERP